MSRGIYKHYPLSEKVKQQIRERMKGEKHYFWTNNPNYDTIHSWLVREFGIANKLKKLNQRKYDLRKRTEIFSVFCNRQLSVFGISFDNECKKYTN